MFCSASMKVSALLPVVILGVLVLPAEAAAVEPASKSSAQEVSDITAETILAAMNEHRARHELEPLRTEVRLSSAAEDRMRDMEDLGYWAHESRRPSLFLGALPAYRFTMSARIGRGVLDGPVTVDLGWIRRYTQNIPEFSIACRTPSRWVTTGRFRSSWSLFGATARGAGLHFPGYLCSIQNHNKNEKVKS